MFHLTLKFSINNFLIKLWRFLGWVNTKQSLNGLTQGYNAVPFVNICLHPCTVTNAKEYYLLYSALSFSPENGKWDTVWHLACREIK